MRTSPARRTVLTRLLTAAAVTVTALAGPAVTAGSPAEAATATTQHLAVPAYFDPGALWTRLDQAGSSVGIAVANPDSGPGSGFDQAYADAIKAATRSGEKVLGYVDTGYFGTTGRTTAGGSTTAADWTAQVEHQVDQWYSWYGSYGLSGVFYDDALGDCGTGNAHVNLYDAIGAYAKQQHSAFTVDNPGAAADSCYASAADVLVTYEGSYADYKDWAPPGWEAGSADPDKFWHLVYATGTASDMRDALALSRERNAGYVYITPDGLPNPWDTLPSGAYWSGEVSGAAGSGPGK